MGRVVALCMWIRLAKRHLIQIQCRCSPIHLIQNLRRDSSSSRYRTTAKHSGNLRQPIGGLVNLGPRQYALRRLPVRESMYETYFDQFLDQVDPFQNAATPEHPDRAMRAFIAPLMQAMAMDERSSLRDAWRAIITHPSYPLDAYGIITADDVSDPELSAMLRAFDAMPDVKRLDGEVLTLNTPADRATIKAGWLRGGWAGEGYWDEESDPVTAYRRNAGAFFRAKFAEVMNGTSTQ